jgi:hypothetical protein
MDRETLIRRLAEIERRVFEGENRIVWLRQLIADLKAAGIDIQRADALLTQCLDMQASYIAQREHLRAERARLN